MPWSSDRPNMTVSGSQVPGAVRWLQVPGPVRATPVVVRHILVQDRPQVPWPGDQHPVGDLGPDGAHPALRIVVRSRAARRDLHRLDPEAGSTASNAPVNCPARSRTMNRNRSARSPQVHQQVPGLLSGPRTVAHAVTPRTWTWLVPT
jgi:hypothetical protein